MNVMKFELWFHRACRFPLFIVCLTVLGARADTVTNNLPAEWIDPDTGHRVIQLSREPGSESLYFNVNPFTPDGQEMVISTPSGISAVNLKTWKLKRVVAGHVRIIMVGHKTGQVYYYRIGENPYEALNGIIYATDLKTKTTREVARLSPGESVATINANETLLAGTITERGDQKLSRESAGSDTNAATSVRHRSKGRMMEDRFNQHLPMELFFLNLKTGETKKYNRCTDWLNHLQFSPTDPKLLMFCHEGPWHKVDRIWTIRTDGTGLTKIQPRTMVMEIAGHEFWSSDGKTIWYDLQTPRGEDFWMAGYKVSTSERTWYHLQREEWSVHFNVSPDGSLFCGDGGDENMVAHASNGKWLYLFHPEMVPDRSGTSIDETGLIRPGIFKAERLVNMARHNYALEPNAMFTPDMKWIIFRSNMSGARQVYAVEVKKADAE